MKKIVPAMLAVALLFCCTTISFAQKDKNKGVMFTTSSNEALSYFTDGLKYYDLWQNTKARDYLQKALQQDPSFAVAYIHLAMLSVTPQEFVSYLDKAKEHISGANEWEKLLYGFTETYLTDNKDSRLSIAQKMTSSFPASARACFYLGQAYSDRSDFTNARKCYQKAVSLEPQWPRAYLALTNSFVFEDPKDFRQAEKTANELVTIAPGNTSYMLLGDTYRAQNNLQKAGEMYSKAITEDPQLPNAYYRRGTILTLSGHYNEARKVYENAGTLDVLPTTARQLISYTYLYQDDAPKALESLDNDLQTITPTLDPTKRNQFQFDLLLSAAMIAWHTLDAPKLQEIINALRPLSEEVGMRIGTEEAKLEQKSGILFWEGALNLIDNNIDGVKQKTQELKTTVEPVKNPRKLEGYYLLLGRAAFTQHDYKAAVSYLEKTDKLDMYHQYWLAKAYEANGQKDKAFSINKYISNFDFNGIDIALIKNEVKKKM
jgi:tetratricopeptide (TPR) repeat protein